MRHAIWLMGVAAFCLAMGAAQSQQDSAAGRQTSKTQPVTTTAVLPANVGEVKFQQNCSRCHSAPQELSARITGTVVLHMRTRASLSKADAEAILKYLAP
jgi:cytochrome c5